MGVPCLACDYVSEAVDTDFLTWGQRFEHSDIYPVTSDGRPEGKLLGFICARCLNRANAMRSWTKGALLGLSCSDAAVTRYRSAPCSPAGMTADTARVSLLRVASRALAAKELDPRTWHLDRRQVLTFCGWEITIARTGTGPEVSEMRWTGSGTPTRIPKPRELHGRGRKKKRSVASKRAEQRSGKMISPRELREIRVKKEREEASRPPVVYGPNPVFGNPNNPPCVGKEFETPAETGKRRC
jgi:hypothetical protein